MTEHLRADGIQTFGGCSNQGYLNAAVYPPGFSCEAMHGCPVNDNCWSVVTWFPGRETVMRCFGSQEDAIQFVRNTIR